MDSAATKKQQPQKQKKPHPPSTKPKALYKKRNIKGGEIFRRVQKNKKHGPANQKKKNFHKGAPTNNKYRYRNPNYKSANHTTQPHISAEAAHMAAHKSTNDTSLNLLSNGVPAQEQNIDIRGDSKAVMSYGGKDVRETKNTATNADLLNTDANAAVQNVTNLHRALGVTPAPDIATLIVYQSVTKMARGLYFAFRTRNIVIGPPAQNDKYRPSIDSNPFPLLHSDAINFIRDLLYACLDTAKKQQRLPCKLPVHISFALNVLANKMLIRTLQGVLDMYPASGVTWENLNSTSSTIITYILQCMELPAYGFALTNQLVQESTIATYHAPDGTAINSTMKMTELASIVGVAIADVDTINQVYTYKCYDWNGLTNPSSTHAFRLGFFADLGNDPANLPSDYDYNLVYLRNFALNPHALFQQFVITSIIPTLEFGYAGNSDKSFFATFDKTGDYATSQGLEYLFERQKNNANDKPYYTTFSELSYNCALFLAIALQTKCNNYYINNRAGKNFNDWVFDGAAETKTSYAVAVAQFLERVPLPSPVFEEIKNFSDLNSWTYIGRPEPVGIQWFADMTFFFQTVTGPDEFFANVKANSQVMFEFRNKVRLNYAPELTGYMPSVHLFVREASSNRLFSVLDSESLRTKDVMIFLNSSVIPTVASPIPLAMNYISVKNFDPDVNLTFLYQMSYDASTNGPSSELDQYYEMLRVKKIGFWGALASLAGAALPYIPKLVSTVVNAFHKKSKPSDGPSASNNSMGSLINTLLQSIQTHNSDGKVALNAPKTNRVMGQTRKNIAGKMVRRYKRL